MQLNRKIKGGIYLVIDPSPGLDVILPAIKKAIAGGVDVLQIWNNWRVEQNKVEIIEAICERAQANHIPVIVNEEWQLLQMTSLDGVHLDNMPENIDTIKQSIFKPFIIGLTCSNDLTRVEWANQHQIDYISFCSMFPSLSAGVCEIVNKETVIKARRLTTLPIFVAGGITVNNVDELPALGIDGIAVISGIMKSDDPEATTKQFKQKFASVKTINNETISNE